MKIAHIYTGKNYLWQPAGRRYKIAVTAVETDADRNSVLILNPNTNQTWRIRATDLFPMPPRKLQPYA